MVSSSLDGDPVQNFDETSSMMDQIYPSMVVTRSDRRGRGKPVQPGNREWATAIVCSSGDGFDVPPLLLVQGAYHLASWYTKGGLPDSWAIEPTSNGWMDNKTALEWITNTSITILGHRQRGPLDAGTRRAREPPVN